MRIFNVSITPFTTGIAVSWASDSASTGTVEWWRTPANRHSKAATSDDGYLHSVQLLPEDGVSPLQTYRVRVVATAGEDTDSTGWLVVTVPDMVVGGSDEAASDRSDLAWRSLIGDTLASYFPPWMALAQAPTLVTASAVDGHSDQIQLPADTADVTLEGIAYRRGHDDDLYRVSNYDQATGVVTLERNLDAEVTTEETWVFSSVGRQLIEAVARHISELQDAFALAPTPYNPARLDAALAWYGHRAEWAGAADAGAADALRAEQDFTVPDGTTRPTLARVFSATDLCLRPYPCYLLVDSTLLFHHLTMVEAPLTPTDSGVTLALPARPVTDTSLYWFEASYGWQRIAPDAYTLGEDGLTATLTTPLATSELRVRFDADIADLAVRLNGARQLAAQHLLWNAFDELGLLVGAMRLPGESNIAYRVRLQAACDLPTGGTRDAVYGWLGIRLGLIERYEWDWPREATFAFPAVPTWYKVMDVPELVNGSFVPLRYGNDRRRCYLPAPLEPGSPFALLVDGRQDTRQLCADVTETVTPVAADALWTLTFSRPVVPNTDLWYAADGAVVLRQLGEYALSEDRLTVTVDLEPIGWATFTSPYVAGTDTGGYILLTPSEAARKVEVNATYRYRLWSYADGVLTRHLPLPDDGRPVVLYALSGVQVTSLTDDTFRQDELLDRYGLPNDVYRSYARALLTLAPITADRAVWGITPWFVRDDVHPQLARLPYGWY